MMKRPRLEYEADPQNPSNKALKMLFPSIYLPKDNPRKPLGEDGHFICGDEQTIGVADGVGGWARYGIDAGDYARELMFNSSVAVLSRTSWSIDPKSVIEEAFSLTKVPGSSTALVLTHSGGVLRSANVGDSGFMLFRDRKLIYRSLTQLQGFNCPYQLGNSETSHRPGCAAQASIKVAEGDVLVVGTDGLFDNMFAEKMEKIMEREWAKKMNNIECNWTSVETEIENLANLIANTALYNSFKKSGVSPFSKAAERAGKFHSGGKIDDITVIVAKFVMR